MKIRGGAWSALALAAIVGGCGGPDPVVDLRRENQTLKNEIRDLKERVAAQQAAIEQLNRELTVARGLTDDDLKKIFYPETLRIGELSGGADYDGEPGDDGVTVYLQPIDRDGDVLKVAGDVRIELYDLAAPEGRKLIGEYYFPADKIAEHWYGQLMTYHYTLECPWQGEPPKHSEITIRATFVDYMTRRVITAQAVCEAHPAP
ncbi:MAG: hypothetical protein D6744_13790 [Planctomycetota bacterium]|nr:MAG: hypothetical protein D6744_13790 [Planctomycetota bacterium]